MSSSDTTTARSIPRKLSLRKNFSWTFVGNFAYTFARWGMLLVLAKLGDATAVGVYALALAVCQPINFLTSLHLRPALVTDARNEYTYSQYLGLRIAGAALTVLIAAAVAFLAGYPPETRLAVIIIGVGTAIFAVREIFQGISQKHERMDVSGRSQIILSFVALGVFAAVFALTHSVVWAALGLVLARVSVMFGYDIPKARAVVDRFALPGESRSFRPDWSLTMLGRLCLRVWPLGLAMTIGSFTNNVQHYFLQGYHGTSLVGYYGALVSVMQAAIILMNTLGIAASPRLANIYVSDRRRFYRLFVRLQGIAVGLGLAGILLTALVGDFVLCILFKPDYAVYTREFIWLAVATTFMFSASVLSTALTAARAFTAQLCVWGVVAPATVVLSWILVPAYGVQGAAWGRTASTAILLVASAVALFVVMKRASLGRLGAAEPAVGDAGVDQ
jgi:O-antigen/teichoic acid export membrane protein